MLKYLIVAILLACGVYWYQKDVIVQPGVCFVASNKTERTMKHMGNKKNFRTVNGRLQVEINGKYLYLKYR